MEVLGQTGLRYREGNRATFIDSEVLTGSAGMAVYRDTISKWDPPYAEAINEAERERILNNVRRAFRFQGFEIEII